jgi:hypothetical protein
MALANDPLKAWIASEVAVNVRLFGTRGIPASVELDTDVTVTRIDDLQTRIKVAAQHGPPRYFIVQVREQF